MKFVAQVSWPSAAFGSQPTSPASLAVVVASLASAVAARSKSSMTTALSSVLSALFVKPDCALSGTNRSAGRVVSPSSSRTTLLYSRRVIRRRGDAPTFGMLQSTGGVTPAVPPLPERPPVDPPAPPPPDADPAEVPPDGAAAVPPPTGSGSGTEHPADERSSKTSCAVRDLLRRIAFIKSLLGLNLSRLPDSGPDSVGFGLA